MKSMRHLPSVLKKTLKSISTENEILGSSIVERLESTMKIRAEFEDDMYYYLVCAGVLQFFGFNVKDFAFNSNLSHTDLENICKMLEAHLKAFDVMHDLSAQQSYILNIAFFHTPDRRGAVQFMIDKFPVTMNRLLEASQSEGSTTNIIDLAKLQHNVER